MKLWLLLIALLVGEICLAEESTVPPKAKNGTGPGRYGHSRNRDYDDDYNGKHRHRDHDDYGKHHHRHRAPIVDDYICDLEATILVVSSKHHVKEEKSYGKSSGYGNNPTTAGYGAPQQQQYGSQYGGAQQSYGGTQQPYGGGQQSYGNNGPAYGGESSSPSYGSQGYENKPKRREYATPDALRLKCSHIAIHSEHDCHTCCQLSARRYHSVSKHEIFGFIIDASELKEDNKGYVRPKRNSDYGSQAPPAPSNYQAQGYGSTPAQSYPAPAPSYTAPEQSYPAPEQSYSTAEPSYSVPSYPAPAPEYQEQPQADSEYSPAAASNSYSAKSYHSYGPPKSARCVCCSPKRHHHDNHKRRRHYDDRSYDRSDSHSNEY